MMLEEDDRLILRRPGMGDREVTAEDLLLFVESRRGYGELVCENNAGSMRVGLRRRVLMGWTGHGCSRRTMVEADLGFVMVHDAGDYEVSWQVSGEGTEGVNFRIGVMVQGCQDCDGTLVGDGIWLGQTVLRLGSGHEVSLCVDADRAESDFVMNDGILLVKRL